MFRLSSLGLTRGRVVVFVPRWLPPDPAGVGLPYRVYPVVSALLRAGYAVDLCHEVHVAAEAPEVVRALDGATAAAVWFAELNPGMQLPGMFAFLEMVRREQPALPRLCGGGFVPLLPSLFDCEGLAELVRSEEVGALAAAVAALHGEVSAERQPFGVEALFAMDLAPFLVPGRLLFRNDTPTLQIPTGQGCGKHCGFCFYEATQPRLLPAAGIAELMGHCHHRFGVRQFQLGELDFLMAKNRALELAERLRQAALPLRWFALASVQDVLAIGTDGLSALAAAGLASLELGTETGTDDGLRRLDKRFGRDDVLEVQRRLRAVGVLPVHNILFGWIGETVAHQDGTRRLVRELAAIEPQTVFHFRLYQAMPGTPMGDEGLRSSPPLPRRWSEIAGWRQQQRRAMPWLTKAAETRARLWCERWLPRAYGEDSGAGSMRRRWLERIARVRCRTGWAWWPFEDRLLAGSGDVRATWLP
ncbi:MAG: radical SAM protein [Planctomycetes bacterium]|nr:radical SAM protein [Planctomycetota bacterium]